MIQPLYKAIRSDLKKSSDPKEFGPALNPAPFSINWPLMNMAIQVKFRKCDPAARRPGAGTATTPCGWHHCSGSRWYPPCLGPNKILSFLQIFSPTVSQLHEILQSVSPVLRTTWPRMPGTRNLEPGASLNWGRF